MVFNRVKNNYRIVAVCSDGEHEGRYTVIAGYDDVWDELVAQKFREEFGTEPTRWTRESIEKI